MSVRKTTEQFITESNIIHNYKYDYSLVKYTTNNTKVFIICPIHGTFKQIPSKHLNSNGCRQCSNNIIRDNKTYTTDIFIIKANKIHNNVYDYSMSEYTTSKMHIRIICQIHGEFQQSPANHLQGNGCPKCGNIKTNRKQSLTLNEFIQKANIIHNNTYDYSKVNYINAHTNIIIICKIHGEFNQRPNNHLHHQGCPTCKTSKGELIIRQWLLTNNIEFEQEYKFDDCIYQRQLPFDFYIKSINMCIEYDGIQHSTLSPTSTWGKHNNFEKIQRRDYIKTTYCNDNGISLLRIPYTQFNNISDILEINILS